MNKCPDNINYKILKKCDIALTIFLADIFRSSMDSGEIPNLWKTSFITPIYKTGNKESPLNYRPISITSGISKIMEKIVAKNITSFFIKKQTIFL